MESDEDVSDGDFFDHGKGNRNTKKRAREPSEVSEREEKVDSEDSDDSDISSVSDDVACEGRRAPYSAMGWDKQGKDNARESWNMQDEKLEINVQRKSSASCYTSEMLGMFKEKLIEEELRLIKRTKSTQSWSQSQPHSDLENIALIEDEKTGERDERIGGVNIVDEDENEGEDDDDGGGGGDDESSMKEHVVDLGELGVFINDPQKGLIPIHESESCKEKVESTAGGGDDGSPSIQLTCIGHSLLNDKIFSVSRGRDGFRELQQKIEEMFSVDESSESHLHVKIMLDGEDVLESGITIEDADLEEDDQIDVLISFPIRVCCIRPELSSTTEKVLNTTTSQSLKKLVEEWHRLGGLPPCQSDLRWERIEKNGVVLNARLASTVGDVGILQGDLVVFFMNKIP